MSALTPRNEPAQTTTSAISANTVDLDFPILFPPKADFLRGTLEPPQKKQFSSGKYSDKIAHSVSYDRITKKAKKVKCFL